MGIKKLVSALFCASALFSSQVEATELPRDAYKQEMQKLIIKLKDAGCSVNPAFGLILNGAENIYTFETAEEQAQVDALLGKIDGVLLEGHNYGHEFEDGKATKKSVKDETEQKLSYVHKKGLALFNIDYFPEQEHRPRMLCYRDSKLDILNFRGVRELDKLPTIYDSGNSVFSLAKAENFCPFLNPQHCSSRAQYLQLLQNSNYDLLIIDAYFWDDMLSKEEVSALKHKPGGGKRLVYAYMSVGEAADYRYYWLPEYKKNPPVWAEKPNPDWPGAYKVRYWLPEWQNIICDSENSYIKMVARSGFDGAFLDVVDAFEYFIYSN